VSEPFPWPLERYRPLLRLRARQLDLHPRLRRRFDSSDLVQSAMLRALEKREQFHGTSEAAFVAWLQRILGNVAADRIDREFADKRDPRREQYLEALDHSSATWEGLLADRQPGPADVAEQLDELLRLGQALEGLPEDQGQAVLARDTLGLSIAETARRMGRSERSVAGLLRRGRERLHKQMHQPREAPHGD
jgi:RNA polymerase sigma-70 factor (ECF subfamily)